MKRNQRLVIVLATIAISLLLMAGCTVPTPAPTATPIPRTPTPTIPPTPTPTGSLDFETIPTYATRNSYKTELLNLDSTTDEVKVITAFDEEDAWQLTELIYDTTAIAAIEEVDFERFFLLGVFRSPKPIHCYNVDVQHITWEGDRLAVFAYLYEPGNGVPCQEGGSAPYHIVKVKRGNLEVEELITHEPVLKPIHLTPLPPRSPTPNAN